MKYNGKELVPITKVQAFEVPKEVVVLISNPWTAKVVYIGQGNRGWFAVTKDGSVIESMVAEIPQYDKSKFKIPHNKATYKEVLEASEMTDEEFRDCLKIGKACNGFDSENGFSGYKEKCKKVITCYGCGVSAEKSKETIEKWMNGEDIWNPKMRDRTREEVMFYLWERNKSECVVTKFQGLPFRPYSKYSFDDVKSYKFATIDETGKITEFEIPQVEEFKGDR